MNPNKSNARQPRLSTCLLSLLAGSLSASCSLSQPATIQASDQPTDTIASANLAVNESTISEVDPADACILNDCGTLPAPRALTEEEFNIIAAEITTEIGSDETLIRNQSLALTLPIIGRADLVATKTQNNKLYLRLRTDPNQYELIYQSHQWTLWDVKNIALEDIQQDGDGPDIIVIADYVTGIGPDGAQPFSLAHVLFNRGDDSFQSDIVVDQILSDRNANTIDSVIEVAQAENLVRGLQYREGPP